MTEPNSVDSASPRHRLLEPVVFGTLCGLSSAILYTVANIFLRHVAHCDAVWVSAVKTVPTALFMVPWMMHMQYRGHRAVPPLKVLAVIAIGGLIGQIGGNVPFQWALGVIGLALTVPISLGGMILFGTILGRFVLHEPVTYRTVAALVILLAATTVLSLGAEKAQRAVDAEMQLKTAFATSGPPGSAIPKTMLLVAGVAAAGTCGLCYAILNVINRYYVTRGHSLPATLCTVSLMGMFSLGGISLLRIGLAGMQATTWHDLQFMLYAGLCNAIAFVALTKSLQLTSVVYVNALNATQATMAALAGILFFQEPLSASLVVGVGLTIAGLVMMRRGKQAEKENPVAEIQDEP